MMRHLQNSEGTLSHSILLVKNQFAVNARTLRTLLAEMKADGLIIETWTHDEHSYSLTADGYKSLKEVSNEVHLRSEHPKSATPETAGAKDAGVPAQDAGLEGVRKEGVVNQQDEPESADSSGEAEAQPERGDVPGDVRGEGS